MPKRESWQFLFNVLGSLGALACILQWSGLTPKDFAAAKPVAAHHFLWLVAGLCLFAASLWSSLRAGFLQKRSIVRLREEALKREADLKDSARRNLDYRATIDRLNAHCEELADLHKDELQKLNVRQQEELEDSQEAYRQCMLERGAVMQGAERSIAQLARFRDQSIADSDPKIYLEFVDDRAHGSGKRELQAYFTLVNRGKARARNIVLEPIGIDGKLVLFTRHRMAAPLLPNRAVNFYPDVVTTDNNSVTDRETDLFHIFCLDYLALGDSTICEATKTVVATYQDDARNLFEVTCELVFDPAAHASVRVGQRGPNPAIFTRNHRFRRIASAISNSNDPTHGAEAPAPVDTV